MKWLSLLAGCIVFITVFAGFQKQDKEGKVVIEGTESNFVPSYFSGGTIFIIPSSHQDIAWMDTPQKCIEFRDKQVITPVMELMRQNPKYTFAMEDTLCLMEYLGRHPDSKDEIARLTKSKNFEWGATYTQPYESMYAGEALIRQAYLGRKWLKKTLPDCDSHIAWNPDVPGRAMQMPQILAKSGINYLLISRQEMGFYRWVSPDGSSILAFSPGHYDAGLKKTLTFELFADDIIKVLKIWEPYYSQGKIRPYCIILDSGDWAGPKNHDVLIEEWNKKTAKGIKLTDDSVFINPPKLKYGLTEEFFKAAEKGYPNFKTITGERPNVWVYIHGPAHHKALSAGREGQRLLPVAEAFSVIGCRLSDNLKGYPQDILNKAWADAIYPDHGWGGNNGHITDRIFTSRMESSRDTAKEIIGQSLNSIASRIETKTEGIPVVVFNGLSWKRTEPVVCEVNTEGRAYVTNNVDLNFQLVDAKGRDIEYQVTETECGAAQSSEKVRILFVAEDVPSFGYKTYYLIQRQKKDSSENKNVVKEGRLENDFYRISLGAGGIKSLYDKEMKKEILRSDKFLGGELFTMQSVGTGAGKFNEVQQPTMEGFEKLGDYKPLWLCTENGPVRSAWETAAKMNHCSIRQKVSLYHKIKRIDFETYILGWDGTKYREFRLAFPLNMADVKVAYEVPMGVVEVGKSEIAGSAGERYVQPCKEVRPREVQDWFCGYDANMGITISSSVAVFDWIDPTTKTVSYSMLQPVLLASRRSCNAKGNWYLQAGDHYYKFSLFSYKGDWRNGRQAGTGANQPLIAICSEKFVEKPSLPEEKSFCSIEPSNMIISALKKCDDDNSVIIRCCEMEGNDAEATINWFEPIGKAERTNMIEEDGKVIETSGSRIKLKITHQGIETVKIIGQR